MINYSREKNEGVKARGKEQKKEKEIKQQKKYERENKKLKN